MSSTLTYRYDVQPDDPRRIRDLVVSTGVFHPVEVDCAEELVLERAAKGLVSGYHFVFAERAGQLVGYACYGPIALTTGSYDLYWIAVDKSMQRAGLGRKLVQETERLVRAEGGRRIYIETSTRPPYAPTRAFYDRCGYHLAAVLEDFYAPGDGKAIYVKAVDQPAAG